MYIYLTHCPNVNFLHGNEMVPDRGKMTSCSNQSHRLPYLYPSRGRGKNQSLLKPQKQSFHPVLCHSNPKTAKDNGSSDQKPKVDSGHWSRQKAARSSAPTRKWNQDYSSSPGARPSFPTSERKLKRLRITAVQ